MFAPRILVVGHLDLGGRGDHADAVALHLQPRLDDLVARLFQLDAQATGQRIDLRIQRVHFLFVAPTGKLFGSDLALRALQQFRIEVLGLHFAQAQDGIAFLHALAFAHEPLFQPTGNDRMYRLRPLVG